MSSSAKHRAWAHKEAETLASAIVAELHNVEEPERHLASRLFPLVREVQKLRFTQAEALGRERVLHWLDHRKCMQVTAHTLGKEPLPTLVSVSESLRIAKDRVLGQEPPA